MLTAIGTVFREAFREILAQKPTPGDSNEIQTAWEVAKENAQIIIVKICISKAAKWCSECKETGDSGKLGVRLRKLRDSIDDIDNEFYEERCTIWSRVAGRFPRLDDIIESILGEDLDPNVPQLLTAQLLALEQLEN
ncbi:hypothetical protein TWF506_000265 [Arthrobotrys conoides]|uniref:Uncharacterized protein n=1 Tax=Arthrobotrys conoides TaxID=74498 RepID=A0AAN8NZW2_9PEZI